MKSEGAIDDTFTVAVNDNINLTAVDSPGRIVIAGLFTGSLALLADAGHMLTDVAALSLSAFAMWMAGKPSRRWKPG